MVRSVREHEGWIERVESLSIEAEVRWEITPEGIAKRRRDLQKQFPGQVIEDHPDLTAKRVEQVELAFDARRIRKRNHQESTGIDDLRVWDGRRFILQNRYEKRPDFDGCLINRDPDKWLYWLLWVDFPAFRAGHHPFWWEKPDVRQANQELAGRPEDFVHGGRAVYRGTDCHVLNLWGSWTTLYVGVADGKLRGLKIGNIGGERYEIRSLAWFKREGYPVRDQQEWGDWFGKLKPDERTAVFRKQAAEMTALVEPCFEFWMEDEKEVAPGCWLPMTQHSIYYLLDETYQLAIDTIRELKIKKVLVNEKLPDSVFEVTIRPGDRVIDETIEPPLQYHHKATFTPEEWSAIIAEGKKRSERNKVRANRQAALIGLNAPPWPDRSVWVDGEPIRWAELTGKVVILDFWAEWCGPCRNSLPVLAAIHDKRAENGMFVIGVHPPGSDMAAIRKVMALYGMTYPVCIEAAPVGATTWGQIFDRLGVDRLPHVVVIDRRGKIAATGSLEEVIAKARELAAEAP